MQLCFERGLIALAALLCAAQAVADPLPVQVLGVQSDDAVDQAQAMTQALKNATKQQASVRLASGDYSFEVLALALGCSDPPDEACLGHIATKVKSDAFVWGTLSKESGKVVLKLHLYRHGEASRETELRYGASLTNADDDALKALADRAVRKLFEAKSRASADEAEEATGKLLLSADDVDGSIVVDGAPAGSMQDGHAELELPVGEHDVSVRADGYRDAEGTITVSKGKHALLRLHPERNGSTHTVHKDRDDHDRSDTEADSDGSGSGSGAGWGAIVVGGALVGAGIYSTVRVNSINHNPDFNSYRAGIPGDQDACTEANRNLVVPGATAPSRISDLCSQSKTFEALQYVFFGLGIVSAGTGALILLTADKAAPASDAHHDEASLVPRLSLGPHGAAVDLRLHF